MYFLFCFSILLPSYDSVTFGSFTRSFVLCFSLIAWFLELHFSGLLVLCCCAVCFLAEQVKALVSVSIAFSVLRIDCVLCFCLLRLFLFRGLLLCGACVLFFDIPSMSFTSCFCAVTADLRDRIGRMDNKMYCCAVCFGCLSVLCCVALPVWWVFFARVLHLVFCAEASDLNGRMEQTSSFLPQQHVSNKKQAAIKSCFSIFCLVLILYFCFLDCKIKQRTCTIANGRLKRTNKGTKGCEWQDDSAPSRRTCNAEGLLVSTHAEEYDVFLLFPCAKK